MSTKYKYCFVNIYVKHLYKANAGYIKGNFFTLICKVVNPRFRNI